MPLRKCPDCGKDVSTSAPTCPHCGRPIAPKDIHGSGEGLFLKGMNLGCGVLLTIVTLIVIGVVLAAVLSPGSAPSSPDYRAAMKSDLRDLVTAEEVFFADSVKYTAKVGRGGLNFSVTPGNTVPVIKLTADGFTVTIGNVNTTTRCAIYVGTTRVSPATKEGVPTCF